MKVEVTKIMQMLVQESSTHVAAIFLETFVEYIFWIPPKVVRVFHQYMHTFQGV